MLNGITAKTSKRVSAISISLDIDLTVESNAWNDCDFSLQELAEKAVMNAIKHSDYANLLCDAEGELSIVLADDTFIQNLNRDYRHKDKATNVLSFPQMEFPDDIEANAEMQNFVAFGDIILAYETIEKEAEEQNKSLRDHLTHLVVHGTLHLMGYDHEEEQEAEEMENLEIKILEEIGIKNPYSDNNFMA